MTTIRVLSDVTASLSDPERGPYFSSQPTVVVWSGDNPAEAARVYYERARCDCSAHPSGMAGRRTSVEVPTEHRAAFDAALAEQHARDPEAILRRLPALPAGWDAVAGTQYDPSIIALRSPAYRASGYGDVVFVPPHEVGYERARAALSL
jgi:hypothetical protein